MYTPGFAAGELPRGELEAQAKAWDPGLLRVLLRDGRPVVRAIAARALALRGDRARPAAGELRLLLKDGEEPVRAAAAEALARLRPDPGRDAPALALALAGATPALTTKLLIALDALGDAAVEPLMALLAGPGERVQATLGRIAHDRPERYALPLGQRVAYTYPQDVRETAADLLARLGPRAREALPALLDALDEPEMLLKLKLIGAVGAVASYHDELGVRMRQVLLDDTRPGVQIAIKDTMSRLRRAARG